MNERKLRRQTERVVAKMLKFVEKQDNIGKGDFEAILDRIIQYVHKNTGVEIQVIAQKTGKVIQDLPKEYDRLDEDAKSGEALIAYLYIKYLQELGLL